VAVVALQSIPAVALLATVPAIVVAAVVIERVRYLRAPSPLLQS
jgi:hypothetical protein